MAVDALEHVDEVGVGIDVVERAGGEQALDLPDLLRAGTPRRTATGPSSEARP
jgi:hypothetical protein